MCDAYGIAAWPPEQKFSRLPLSLREQERESGKFQNTPGAKPKSRPKTEVKSKEENQKQG
jgi:hypothetical protein